MLPVLITAFVLTYESLRDKWYMKSLFYLSVLNFILQQILQITGVLYYMQMITVVHLLFILMESVDQQIEDIKEQQEERARQQKEKAEAKRIYEAVSAGKKPALEISHKNL